MKQTNFLYVILIVILSTSFFAGCDKEPEELIANRFINNPLPHNPQKLKILGIGNSFTEDAMIYLPHLCQAAGLNNIILGMAYNGGLSLQHHDSYFSHDNNSYYYLKSIPEKNKWENQSSKRLFSLREILAEEDWDIIVLQQLSQSSGVYETYQPFLENIVNNILKTSTNKKVCLAWHMTWAYATGYKQQSFVTYEYDQMKMYWAIVNATGRMKADSGIDIIIPSGMTIQKLRTSSLNNPPLDLTRDGIHIDYGIGRYALACTWFESLISPCTGISVVGNSYRASIGNIPVTDKNATVIQKTARDAALGE